MSSSIKSSASSSVPIPWEILEPSTWSNILSYLSLFEWKISHLVNKRWNLNLAPKALNHVKCLDFSQFWANFGDEHQVPKIVDIMIEKVEHLHKVKAISFAFCHNLSDNVFGQWIRAIPVDFRARITHLNLYFCKKLTNASVLSLSKSFPNLKYLNLGSCFQLTDTCVSAFSRNSMQLKHLVLTNDEKFTEDVLIDLTSHPSLEIVDIQRTKIPKEVVDEYKNMGTKVMILGPGVYVPPPPSSNPSRLQKRNSNPQISQP